jgi:hypothetical protein
MRSNRAVADRIHQDLASDLRPLVHVGMHLSPVLLVRSGTKPVSGVEQTMDGQVLPFWISHSFSDAQLT